MLGEGCERREDHDFYYASGMAYSKQLLPCVFLAVVVDDSVEVVDAWIGFVGSVALKEHLYD